MADNLDRRQPEDAARINVNESWELRYWTQKFGVSETELRQAVKSVGTSADKVRDHLDQ